MKQLLMYCTYPLMWRHTFEMVDADEDEDVRAERAYLRAAPERAELSLVGCDDTGEMILPQMQVLDDAGLWAFVGDTDRVRKCVHVYVRARIRTCVSVRPSARPPVRPPVRPSVYRCSKRRR